jgi:hypothetical protein
MVDVDPMNGNKDRKLRALSRHQGHITFGIFLKGGVNIDENDIIVVEGGMLLFVTARNSVNSILGYFAW